MRKGYWKFHRKTWDNPYMKRPYYVSVWCWILSEAQFEYGKTVLFKGRRVELRPGQLTAGAYQISKATGVPRGTVERIVKLFESEEQIKVQRSNKCSLYTIRNWGKYQAKEEQSEEQMRNKRGTDEEQVRTTEELKNDKNVKKKKDTNLKVSKPLGKDVNQLIELFEPVNPSWKRLFANKTQRAAIERMVKEHGKEQFENICKLMAWSHGRKFAPRITTPLQLETKMGELSAFAKEQKRSVNRVVKI